MYNPGLCVINSKELFTVACVKMPCLMFTETEVWCATFEHTCIIQCKWS